MFILFVGGESQVHHLLGHLGKLFLRKHISMIRIIQESISTYFVKEDLSSSAISFKEIKLISLIFLVFSLLFDCFHASPF